MAQQAGVDWLLDSDETAVRFLTGRDVLGRPEDADASSIPSGPKVTALLSGQQADGGFGGNAYRKWTGAHWRLVSLVELAVPQTEPRAVAAANHVLDWLVPGGRRRGSPTVVDGLPRVHASVDGNALAASCRLGLATDPRAQILAESLLSFQWPDGGWNCDINASGHRSSFYESLAAAWGLHEYAEATGDSAARNAAARTAELFLEHRLVFSLGTGEVISPRWLQLRYPSYWHYDILQVLLVLARMGKVADPRAGEALDELERRRLPDGRWKANGRWWRPPGSGSTGNDVVDWGPTGQPNEMITLNALRVLRAAGRVRLP